MIAFRPPLDLINQPWIPVVNNTGFHKISLKQIPETPGRILSTGPRKIGVLNFLTAVAWGALQENEEWMTGENIAPDITTASDILSEAWNYYLQSERAKPLLNAWECLLGDDYNALPPKPQEDLVAASNAGPEHIGKDQANLRWCNIHNDNPENDEVWLNLLEMQLFHIGHQGQKDGHLMKGVIHIHLENENLLHTILMRVIDLRGKTENSPGSKEGKAFFGNPAWENPERKKLDNPTRNDLLLQEFKRNKTAVGILTPINVGVRFFENNKVEKTYPEETDKTVIEIIPENETKKEAEARKKAKREAKMERKQNWDFASANPELQVGVTKLRDLVQRKNQEPIRFPQARSKMPGWSNLIFLDQEKIASAILLQREERLNVSLECSYMITGSSTKAQYHQYRYPANCYDYLKNLQSASELLEKAYVALYSVIKFYRTAKNPQGEQEWKTLFDTEVQNNWNTLLQGEGVSEWKTKTKEAILQINRKADPPFSKEKPVQTLKYYHKAIQKLTAIFQ